MSGEIVTWRGEYDPLTPRGAVRFVVELWFAIAILFKGGCHVIGTLAYAEDRERRRDEMDARIRVWRFSVASPDVPRRTQALIRFWTGLIGLAYGVMLVQNGWTLAPGATVIAATNWGLVVADPAMFVVEHYVIGGT
jgi:hypothetical protein